MSVSWEWDAFKKKLCFCFCSLFPIALKSGYIFNLPLGNYCLQKYLSWTPPSPNRRGKLRHLLTYYKCLVWSGLVVPFVVQILVRAGQEDNLRAWVWDLSWWDQTIVRQISMNKKCLLWFWYVHRATTTVLSQGPSNLRVLINHLELESWKMQTFLLWVWGRTQDYVSHKVSASPGHYEWQGPISDFL